MGIIAKLVQRFKGFLTIGEQEALKRLSEFLPLMNEANQAVAEMVSGRDLTAAVEKMRKVERKADELSFSMVESITGGAISPSVLDNLLKAVNIADSIVDYHYNLSREIERMANAKLTLPQEQLEFTQLFGDLLELAQAAFDNLRKLLSSSTVEEMFAARRAIQRIEEGGDDIKDRGFDRLYAMARDMSYVQFIHYSEILHKLDDILDACEDLADLVVSVVVSVSR